jgi:CheY-like chemotaxis protein/HPt (histidine-containing phosphotransfer) domain-containing protein
MGGRIWVESQAGAGSTFHVTVLAAAASPAADQATPAQLAGKRLLIVEARRRSRQALVAYARSWGMQPCATASASEALAWLREGQPFDIAVVDAHNGEIPGLALVTELRRHRQASELPLLMLDQLGRRDPRLKTADGEMQIVLRKPLKQLQLQAALISILEGRAFHPSPPSKRLHSGARPLDAGTPRILLAEDDAINQQVTLHILQKLGYATEVVRDGALAIEALARQDYDVVLLDVQMPEKDGLEVARTIRQRWPADRRPYLIAVTANAVEGAREECLAAGMDDYITKPIQIEELIKVIEMRGLRARADDATEAVGAAIDVATLQQTRQLLGEDAPQQLERMIVGFLDDTAELLGVMGRAASTGDAEAIGRAAHKLKSSSAIMAATILSELCDQLEYAVRTNAQVDLAEQVKLIEAEFARVRTALSA